MILLIAWRNIWRSKVRSLVMIGAVSIGIWSLIVLLGLSEGMIVSYIDSTIKNKTSHIQVHHPEWLREREIGLNIDGRQVSSVLDTIREIEAYTERVIVNGMIQSARSSRSISLIGIYSAEENRVTALADMVTEGHIPEADERNAILISASTAGHLKLSLKNKVVVSFQDTNGDIVNAALKITGIYDMNDTQFEDMYAFMNFDALSGFAGLPEGYVQEVAIKVRDFDRVKEIRGELAEALPEMQISDYGEISPEIELYNSSLSLTVSIMTAIVMLALIFGIINTMLMAILERERELGMLRAVGMKRKSVFSMVVLETILLSVTGLPVGLLLGWGSIELMAINGIDLSRWAGGLSQFGLSNMLYPSLGASTYVVIMIAIFFTAILASIYPAWKAVTLKPLEAMHRI